MKMPGAIFTERRCHRRFRFKGPLIRLRRSSRRREQDETQHEKRTVFLHHHRSSCCMSSSIIYLPAQVKQSLIQQRKKTCFLEGRLYLHTTSAYSHPMMDRDGLRIEGRFGHESRGAGAPGSRDAWVRERRNHYSSS